MSVRSIGPSFVVSVVACGVWTACSAPQSVEEAPEPVAAVAVAAHADPVARGEYLVTIMSCNDCHTPLAMGPQGPAPDMSRMLSGHPEALVMPAPPALGDGPWQVLMAGSVTAFAGPWGISYAANLTPDASGMAAWDEATFIQAMRTGKHFGTSRDILPPMPWSWISRATDEDLAAIFAYLRSIPPVVNHVPDPVPPATAAGTAAAGG